jgi:hypothetical protein
MVGEMVVSGRGRLASTSMPSWWHRKLWVCHEDGVASGMVASEYSYLTKYSGPFTVGSAVSHQEINVADFIAVSQCERLTGTSISPRRYHQPWYIKDMIHMRVMAERRLHCPTSIQLHKVSTQSSILTLKNKRALTLLALRHHQPKTIQDSPAPPEAGQTEQLIRLHLAPRRTQVHRPPRPRSLLVRLAPSSRQRRKSQITRVRLHLGLGPVHQPPFLVQLPAGQVLLDLCESLGFGLDLGFAVGGVEVVELGVDLA